MSDGLLPQHAVLLTASAISDEVAEARGYRSVEQKARLTELGFSSTQARVPALLIPIWNVQGEIALYQTRTDEPRIVTDAEIMRLAIARHELEEACGCAVGLDALATRKGARA